ncbi:hypothetical protein K504DRAFT_498304 [Pleomassaria siparia CBS 279.74]|uniref:Uncharacterized protein n=1 Tax=Pleomassaria siparia CBS 279.74 TaxID=1314801 RepID=A0A6G1KLI9_9PLEO|nr:hypothetical protein K504DRAFT_498304 [Pleomassaria siparia CBS 279.74]
MLDEALPTFFLKPASDKLKHHESFLYTQHGSDPEARYALHHLDPAANEARNTYAAALFDSYYPDILYGEVLAKPGWQQPTLSQEEIRKNGGLPPPPQPIFPTEFTIQLYNPDQQIVIRQQTTKWSGSLSYEFSMPMTTFRTPSSSSLDRSQNDPGVDAATPKINFMWRKEGRIGKDMTCYLTGKSTDLTGKKAKKSKEPDIAVALFSGLKEMTIMESNLYRVEVEDYKGLEVVLLLGAAVIRDLFFSNTRESFHIIDPNTRKNSGGLRGKKSFSPLAPPITSPPINMPQPLPQQRPIQTPVQPAKPAATNALYNQPSRNDAKRTSLPPLRTGTKPVQRLDPRAQWEIDAETERLKVEVEVEAREYRRQEALKQRARKRAEEEETRKTRQFLEQEDRQRQIAEKERRRRQAEVDKETERLRRQYGNQGPLLTPAQPQQRHSTHAIQGQWQTQRPTNTPVQPARPVPQGPYLQPAGHRPAVSQSSFFSNGLSKPVVNPKMKKKSFWGLRSASEQSSSSSTLRKKQSSMF